MLSSFLKSDAKHIFDSEFDFVGNANGKLTTALRRSGLATDSFPHFSISRLVARAPDGRLRAFMSINSSKGPIVGTASLRVALASAGFLADLGTVSAEIAEFALGMAADDLLANIGLARDGHRDAAASAYEVLSDLRALGSRGYRLVSGGGGDLGEDLIGAFQRGSRATRF